ncbi:MAG: peptidoglycan-binding domain-containing protein [Pyrinomonadaceae bacterium]
MFRKIFFVVSVSLFLSTASYAQAGSATAPVAAPTPAAAKAPKAAAFRPTKDQVRQGQTMLKDKKLYVGEPSGVYNDPTRAAIKTFQKDNGLDPNGKFDRLTLEKMSIALTDNQKGIAASPAAPKAAKSTMATPAIPASGGGPKKPAPFQATEDQIMALQKILKDAGMYSGDVNGERSDVLKGGVKKYQEANKLKVTGGINAATLDKMSIALTDGQKANVAAQAAYDAATKKN